MIPQSTIYAELMEKISQVININTSEFKIITKFKLNTSNPMTT